MDIVKENLKTKIVEDELKKKWNYRWYSVIYDVETAEILQYKYLCKSDTKPRQGRYKELPENTKNVILTID